MTDDLPAGSRPTLKIPDSDRAVHLKFISSLVIGVLFWFWCEEAHYGWPAGWLIVPTFLLVSHLRLSRGVVSRLASRATSVTGVAVGLSVVTVLYLLWTAYVQRRDLFPRYHDEFMYLLQARMLTTGRLWITPPPMPDFFESIYVLVKPVYASLSWPGTAIFYAPGVAAGLASWVTPLALTGTIVGLFFSLLRRHFGIYESILGVIMLVSLTTFRQHAFLAMSELPTLVLGLALTLATLQWRKSHSASLALFSGAAIGLLAITRPIDCLCFGLPVAVAWAAEMPRKNLKVGARSLVLAAAASSPFLAVQLAFDHGVTGRFLTAPFNYYCQQDYPQVVFGVEKYDPKLKPQSSLPQKQILYQSYIAPFVRHHTPDTFVRDWIQIRLPMTVEVTVPHPLLAILLPLGLVAAFRAGWYAFLLVTPALIFLGLYSLYTIFHPNYPVPFAPAIITLILLAAVELRRTFPRVRPFILPLLLGMTVSAFPEFSGIKDDAVDRPTARACTTLSTQVRAPAVVFFRFEPGCDVHDEPVYNLDFASPEESPVIRVQDLGASRDLRLIQHFAARQPDRHFYRFDRRDNSLHDLGVASELARRGSDDKR